MLTESGTAIVEVARSDSADYADMAVRELVDANRSILARLAEVESDRAQLERQWLDVATSLDTRRNLLRSKRSAVVEEMVRRLQAAVDSDADATHCLVRLG